MKRLIVLASLVISAFITTILFAQENSFTVVIAQQNANIRSKAASDGALVGALNRGENARIIAEDANGENVNGISLWYQVQLPAGAEGWVWSGAVLTAQVTPTPTPMPRPTLPPNPHYESITNENISDLELIHQWGKGILGHVAWSANNDRFLVSSTAGLWLYEIGNLSGDAKLITPLNSRAAQIGFIGNTDFAWALIPLGDGLSWGIQTVNTQNGRLSVTIPTQFDRTNALTMGNGDVSQVIAPVPSKNKFAIVEKQNVRFVELIFNAARNEITSFVEETALKLPFDIKNIAFSPDGTRLAVIGNNQIQLYTYPELTRIAANSVQGQAATQLVFSPDSATLLVIEFQGFDQVLAYYAADDGRRLRKVNVPFGFLDAEISASGPWLAASYRLLPRGVQYIDIETGEEVGLLSARVNYSDIAYSPNGEYLAGVSTKSGVLTIWDSASGEEIFTERYPASLRNSDALHFDATSQTLFVYTDTELLAYDPYTARRTLLHSIPLPQWHILDKLIFDTVGERIFVTGMIAAGPTWDSVQQLLDWNGTPLSAVEQANTVISGGVANPTSTAFTFSPDGQLLAVGSRNGGITLYDGSHSEIVKKVQHGNLPILSIRFSEDGNSFASSSEDGTITVWTTDGQQRARLIAPHNSEWKRIAISHDGIRVVAIDGYHIYVWNVADGQVIWSYESPQKEFSNALVDIDTNPDFTLLAVSDNQYRIVIYDLNTGEPLKRVSAARSLSNLVFSPDGAILTAADSNGTIYTWGIPRQVIPQITPTALPSATPTASPTATATPDNTNTLFYDDFEDGDLAGWDTGFAGNAASISAMDGNRVLYLDGTQNDFVSLGFTHDVNGANLLEAQIRFLDFGTSDGAMNINLMSANPGHGSGYSVLLSRNGGFLATRDGGFNVLDANVNKPFQLQVNQWYKVRFKLSDRTLRLWINDTLVRSARVPEKDQGSPVFIFDRGMEIYLDNVHISVSP